MTIASLLSGEGLDMGPLEPIIDDPETHHCPLCAQPTCSFVLSINPTLIALPSAFFCSQTVRQTD
jgi:hypothetical protein